MSVFAHLNPSQRARLKAHAGEPKYFDEIAAARQLRQWWYCSSHPNCQPPGYNLRLCAMYLGNPGGSTERETAASVIRGLAANNSMPLSSPMRQ